jgi:hypothetical protein
MRPEYDFIVCGSGLPVRWRIVSPGIKSGYFFGTKKGDES